MEASENWNVCRICSKVAEEMRNIYDATHLVKQIEEYGAIILNPEDNMPKSICSKCLLMLKVAHQFRILCQESQQKLLQLLASSSETIDIEVVVPDIEMKKEYNTNNAVDEDLQFGTEEIDEVINGEEFIEEINREEDCVTVDLETAEIISHDTKSGDMVFLTQEQFDFIKQNKNFEDGLPQNETLEATEIIVISDESVSDVTSLKPTEVKVHTYASNYICPYCGNFYQQKSKLKLHLKIHMKQKKHQCEICLKKFAQTPQLQRHMNSHTGNRPFKCKFCAASFADPSTCIKHQRIHTNERPYNCTECGKSFSYSNVLKVHMMTHTGEKPYSCKFCSKKFSQLHHKNYHENIHR